MSRHRPIIDAGPGLNFLCSHKERLLISVLGPLSAPEAVQDEVLRKARQDERFRAAGRVWRRLTVAAEAGKTVSVLIDDGPGARIATLEINRLRRLQAAGHTVGSVRLVSTLTVLRRAAGGEHIPDRAAMRDIYQRLRGLDDGLPPIETTSLLSPDTWS